MSEHSGLEFAPQSPRSQNSPSMPPLVLFIISMLHTPRTLTKLQLPRITHALSLCHISCYIFVTLQSKETVVIHISYMTPMWLLLPIPKPAVQTLPVLRFRFLVIRHLGD